MRAPHFPGQDRSSRPLDTSTWPETQVRPGVAGPAFPVGSRVRFPSGQTGRVVDLARPLPLTREPETLRAVVLDGSGALITALTSELQPIAGRRIHPEDRHARLTDLARELDWLIDHDDDRGPWREYVRGARRMLTQAINAEFRRSR